MTGTGSDERETVPAHPRRTVRECVQALAAQHLKAWRDSVGRLPDTQHDPDWPSACIQSTTLDGRCLWQPAQMAPPPDLTRLAAALDVTLHADWCQLFSVHWSAALPLVYNGGNFDLLQLWNEQDADNLIANHIGHALEKRRIRQPLTLFFGLVDDDRLLSIDNASGAVLLETLGTPGPLEVAADLPAFLSACEPAAPQTT